MRSWQARCVGPAIMAFTALSLAVSIGIAQQGGQTGGGGTGTGTGKGTPTPTPTITPRPTTQTPTSTTAPSTPPRPIWVTGRVMMYDGAAPPESVTIERLCSANSVRAEGFTDSRGQFSFNLGQNNGVFSDASTALFPDSNQQGGFNSTSTGNSSAATSGMSNMNQDSQYWDCELRARLPGYRSETVSLAGRRVMDSPDVGVILLYPIAGIQGLTASATSGQAPKDAKKAYQKGLDAVKKEKPDQAEQEFRKAVGLYPRYAEAWYELGKTLERRDHYPEAREAYASALAADTKYVYPYQQLYQLALREQNWRDLAEKTDQLLRLDPYEFPAAYYFNALAHLQLKEYDAAEKSAHQAVEADRKKANPKTHYLLGAILIQKKSWTAAAESFRAYLKAAPDATDKAQVEKTLGQLDQQIAQVQQVQPASQDSAAQR
jgi:tetratricopeptide (TPR) repeat protein